VLLTRQRTLFMDPVRAALPHVWENWAIHAPGTVLEHLTMHSSDVSSIDTEPYTGFTLTKKQANPRPLTRQQPAKSLNETRNRCTVQQRDCTDGSEFVPMERSRCMPAPVSGALVYRGTDSKPESTGSLERRHDTYA
jgi:hypothetical protein